MLNEDYRIMFRGDDKTFRVIVVDANDVVVPITGDKVEFTVKKNATDLMADAIIYKSSLVHGEIDIRVAPNTNQADINLVPADTDLVPTGEYVFDVQLTRVSTGKVLTIVKGVLSIEQDVTQAVVTP
jgi:hypothetical protein